MSLNPRSLIISIIARRASHEAGAILEFVLSDHHCLSLSAKGISTHRYRLYPFLRETSSTAQEFVGASHSPEYAAISDEKIEERDDPGAEKPGPVSVVVDVGGVQP